LTYAGAYGGEERRPVSRSLRRDGHPLGVRRELIDEPEDVIEDVAGRKWHFGVAAGALLVAGTFAAGALGIGNSAAPFAGSAPEHAPASPGNGPFDSGPPPMQAAPPTADEIGGHEQGVDPQSTSPASTAPNGQNAPVEQTPAPGGGDGGTGRGGAPAPAPAPDPAPQPDPQPQPQPQPSPGGGGGGLLDPVTGAVGGILSPSSASTTAAPASGAGEQPALTMIDPLGDLLGG